MTIRNWFFRYSVVVSNTVTKQKKTVARLPYRWMADYYAKFREFASVQAFDFYSVRDNNGE